jgi:hypothetical protein
MNFKETWQPYLCYTSIGASFIRFQSFKAHITYVPKYLFYRIAHRVGLSTQIKIVDKRYGCP